MGDSVSDDLVVCPSCELEVPDGRFCKACGKPLHPEVEAVLTEDDEDVEVTSSAPLPDFLRDDYDEAVDDNIAAPPPEFQFTIDGMDSDWQLASHHHCGAGCYWRGGFRRLAVHLAADESGGDDQPGQSGLVVNHGHV